MKPNTRRLLIAFIVLAFVATAALTSCSSKKKTVEKTKTEIATTKSLDSTATETNVIASAEKQSKTSKETTKEETIEYQGEVGDTLKIFKLGENGKIISGTILTGKGKANFKTKDKTENKTANKTLDSLKISGQKVSVKSEEDKKEASAIKKAATKRTGVSFTTWLWIIGIVAAIIAIWYLNKKFAILLKIKKVINSFKVH